MPYPSEGNLVTDKREIAVSETWESQIDWEAFQESNNVEIVDGTILLEDIEVPEDVMNHYPTDEGSGSTLFDNVSNVDGTIDGPTWQTLSDAVGGQFLLYDGTDDGVNLGTDSIDYIWSGDFTWTAFVRADDTSNRDTIISHTNGSNGIAFEIDNDGTLQALALGVAFIESSLSVTQGEWHFVSLRVDKTNSDMIFGLDGSYETVSYSSLNEASSSDVYIGRRSHDTDNVMEGGIDELTSSDALLSESDLSDLRNRRSDV